jgi:hypothetical protein
MEMKKSDFLKLSLSFPNNFSFSLSLLMISLLMIGVTFWRPTPEEEKFNLYISRELKIYEEKEPFFKELSDHWALCVYQYGYSKEKNKLRIHIAVDPPGHQPKLPHEEIFVTEVKLTNKNTAKLAKKAIEKVVKTYLAFLKSQEQEGNFSFPAPAQLFAWKIFKGYILETINFNIWLKKLYIRNFNFYVPELVENNILKFRIKFWSKKEKIEKVFRVRIPENFSIKNKEKIDLLASETTTAARSAIRFLANKTNSPNP